MSIIVLLAADAAVLGRGSESAVLFALALSACRQKSASTKAFRGLKFPETQVEEHFFEL